MNKMIKKIISYFLILGFLLNVVLPAREASAMTAPWWSGSQGYDSTSVASAPPGENCLTDNRKNQEKAGEPVSVHNGDFIYQHQDILIPSRGMPTGITRTYKSQSRHNNRFGYGWDISYNKRIVPLCTGDLYYFNGELNRYKFIYIDGTNYVPPEGVYDTIVQNGDGTYTLTERYGKAYEFDQNGLLTEIRDRNGNSLHFSYDPAGDPAGKQPIIGKSVFSNDPDPKVIAYDYKLIKITDTVGREITLNYNSDGRLQNIVDFSGRTYTYTYDPSDNGDLISFTTPATAQYPTSLTTTYSYTGHNLEAITDAKGQAYLTNYYDASDRVYQQDYGSGRFIFSYDTANSITTVTDPKSFVTEWHYDSKGNPLSKKEYTAGLRPQDPASYTTSYQHNSNLERTSITYPAGNGIKYTYDEANPNPSARGNLLEIRRKPDMAQPNDDLLDLVTTFTYEPNFNQIKTITDPRGNVTTYNYDSKGNLLKIIYPTTGAVTPETNFTYNAYGQPETVTDPNLNLTKYEYYPDTGYLKKITAGFGSANEAATQLSYDAAGNITTITDPRTNTTNFTYNALNQLTQTTSPAPFNYLTKYSYDRNGNLTQIDRQTDDPGNPWQTTTYTYTILDELATIADDLGNITTFGYDANGNRSSVQDAKLNTTTYVYDERGLLWKVTDALSNTTEYSYDGNENLLQLKDAKSNTTTYQYDDFNRLTQTTYPDSTTESYSYDKAANLLSKTNRRSQIISYAYDELNRITTKTTPETTINYAYDAASRLTSVIASGSEAISYVYDALNRVTSVTYPGPRVVSYEYDTAGNRTKLTYPDSTYITYSYDTMNRLTNIINSSAQNIATYSYDKLSRRIGGNFLNGTSAGYTYDAIDRLTQLANTYTPTPSTYSYTYDNVGNRLTKTDNTGAETYTYDNIYQLTNVTYPDTSSTAYNYDGVGNRTSTVNGGTTTYTSNNLNQYSEVNSIPYTYDSSGNLTSDGTQIYTYDSENRLSHVIPAPPHTSLRGSEATEAIYTYDAFGRRIEKAVTINSQLSTINYLYDGDQVICEYEAGAISAKYVYGAGIDEPITMQRGGETYYYHFDGLGSVTALTNNTGALVESYSYDVYGNTIIKDASGNPLTQSAIGNHFGFTGRELDNETGLYHYRARAYSPTLGRFLQTDPVGYYDDINLYRYCWNNPINYIDPFGLCKEENKGVLPGGIYNPNVINATIKLPRPEVEKQTGIPTSKNPTPTEPSRRPTEVNIALDAVAFAADVVGTVVPPAFIPAYVVGTTASITNLSYTESQYHKGKATRLDVWVSRTTTAIGIIPGPVGIIGSVVQLAYDLIRQRVGP